MKIVSGPRVDTEFSADSVEWCPVKGIRNVVAVGTYQVDKSSEEKFSASQRRGRIYLHLAKDGNEGGGDSDEPPLSPKDFFHQRLDTPAVLDLKWSASPLSEEEGSPAALAAADAMGRITLFSLEDDKNLEEVCSAEVAKDDEKGVKPLVLSLDWSDRRNKRSEGRRIVGSDSAGRVNVFSLSDQRNLEEILSKRCHDYEAWTACFDAWSEGNVVYSGGDDCRLRRTDVREGPDSAGATARRHEAGVTNVLSCVAKENVLFSGSYDEVLCEWDTRSFRRPISESRPGGGIWRIRQHPDRPEILALACTDDGFKVVARTEEGEGGFRVLAHHGAHESLAYGIDWRRAEEQEECRVGCNRLASCSFYDHLLTLWALKEDDISL